jgi:hypothetical protein
MYEDPAAAVLAERAAHHALRVAGDGDDDHQDEDDDQGDDLFQIHDLLPAA